MRPRLPLQLAFMVLALAATPARAQLRLRLDGDSATFVSLGGALRLRGENWSGFGAGAAPGQDFFALSRVLLKSEFRYRGWGSVVAEVKSSLAASRSLPGEERPIDEDVLDVQQLYAEFRPPSVRLRGSVRVGRFDLALGRERLVSPLDWVNSRRTFQGAATAISLKGIELRAFWVEPVAVRRRKPNTVDSTRQLYGIHLAKGPLEAYWLRHELRANAQFNNSSGPERRHTLGARVVARPRAGRVDYDAEAAWQTGRVGVNDVSAWMAGSQIGWSAPGRLGARLYAGFDYGSGDDAPGGDVGTFNQLYPLGHAFLGYIDLHGRQNVMALNLGASLRPLAGHTVQLDIHEFRRASRRDALYGVDGSVLRAVSTDPLAPALPARVGAEVDLTVRRSLMAGHLVLQGGVSRYFAGAFLEAAGPTRDVTWAYGQATVSW